MYKSLDERQIWQTATRGLAQILKVNHCQIELYDSRKTTATVAYEYATTSPLEQGIVRKTADFPELYNQLLNTQFLQFGERIPFFSPKSLSMTRLACPIHDEQEILGNLWLLRPQDQIFYEWEIKLVQQVANQCANSLYQTRFYKQAWTQLKELEEVNQRKDEFFQTISHELRGQTTSIQLAAQTLENLLEKERLTKKQDTLSKVFHIFQQACQRQTQLVNDLLTLCHMDMYKETIIREWIDLKTWIPKIVEPFLERVHIQQQHLKLDIANNIPKLKTDSSTLERIVIELIHNACKYTPEGETITISINKIGNQIKIQVSNSGVEIPIPEQKRIFDQFYRLPGNDPWSMGGTGLGLALIKKLVKFIDASIELESKENKTKFTLIIPIR